MRTFIDSYYQGKSSIYEGMRSWAAMIYPPNHRFDSTSDKVSNLLLSTISGVPYPEGRELRIFNKVIACELLAQHLSGNLVNLELARKIYDNDKNIYYSCKLKQLNMIN